MKIESSPTFSYALTSSFNKDSEVRMVIANGSKEQILLLSTGMKNYHKKPLSGYEIIKLGYFLSAHSVCFLPNNDFCRVRRCEQFVWILSVKLQFYRSLVVPIPVTIADGDLFHLPAYCWLYRWPSEHQWVNSR